MSSSEILALITGYGLAGVFVMALVEKFLPIMPSYLMLMIFGMATESIGDVMVVLVVSTVASTAASAAWYGIGDFLGDRRVRRIISKYGRFVFFSIESYERLRSAYRRNAFAVSLAGQGVPVARIYLALPAGVMRVGFRVFTLAAALGIAVYNLAFLTVGHLLRSSGQDPLTTGLVVAGVLVAVEFLILLVLRRRSRLRAA
ncbi:VTT domain-containing protein [Stenotrophomonas maltophilia]|nr:VTT domain-containing protein [Stenotrophomonas maltophilia]